MTDNFFTDALHQHYLGSGQKLSDTVINVLNKSPFDLSEEEKEVYQSTVLPMREGIKNSLSERLRESGASRDEWMAQLPSASQSIIGMLATEMLASYDDSPVVESSGEQEDEAAEIPAEAEAPALAPTPGAQPPEAPIPAAEAMAATQPEIVKKKMSSKKKWLIIGVTGGLVIAAIVAFLLVYFIAIKPGADYDNQADKIKVKAISIVDDASQKGNAFESGKTTFGEAGEQFNSIIEDCKELKGEAKNISVPGSREESQEQLISTLNDLEQAYTYYKQYVTHTMTGQGSDKMIELYEQQLADYQNKLSTTGYSFYQDYINDTQRDLDQEKADQTKNYDMAIQELADYSKLISSCRSALEK